MDELDNNRFRSATQQETAEIGRTLNRFQRSPELLRDFSEPGNSAVKHIVERKEIHVVGFAMAEIETSESSATGQKESALAPEKRFEEISLESGELIFGQSILHPASD